MKKILITGATGGIGNVLSRHLLKQGYEIVLFARNLDRLSNLSSEISSEFKVKSPDFYSLDFGDHDQVQKFNYDVLGKIDGVVIMPPQLEPVADPFASPDSWKNIFNESFIGPVEFLKNIIPNLLLADRSKIVLISGISSFQALSHYATSNVLRCAWVGQAKTLSTVLGEKGIHLNTLSLGGVLTSDYMSELIQESETSGISVQDILLRETSNVPLKKYATPLEISYAVEGLLGSFSDHITGANIAVDGGYTRAY